MRNERIVFRIICVIFVILYFKSNGWETEGKDATEVFIADLIACSTCFGHHYAHHQELKSIIQWLLPVVYI